MLRVFGVTGRGVIDLVVGVRKRGARDARGGGTGASIAFFV